MMQFEYPEGATPLDPNEAHGLRLAHVTTQAELNRWEQENIAEALVWIGRRRKGDILTVEFLKELHERMYSKVWKWAGEFRETEKNIGVYYKLISLRTSELLDTVRYWVNHKTYSPDEIAYRFHHQLVLIHAFPNGNGRHSRLMADLLLEEILGEERFTWGSTDLTAQSDIRSRYIAALKKADERDYSELHAFVRS
jgi:Fic-DOC domain mobile mystery protein B